MESAAEEFAQLQEWIAKMATKIKAQEKEKDALFFLHFYAI